MARVSRPPLPPSVRQLQALDLRRQGLSYTQIATEMGITRRRVGMLITEAISRQPFEEIETVRKLELERLDDLWRIAWSKAKAGELPAIDRCIKVMERRAAMIGLDAPRRTDIHTFDGDAELDSSIRALLEEMARKDGDPDHHPVVPEQHPEPGWPPHWQ